MKLKLNGTESEVKDNLTVAGLLQELKIEPKGVAVEVNLNIIKKLDYDNCLLREGDSVEIVNCVGGG